MAMTIHYLSLLPSTSLHLSSPSPRLRRIPHLVFASFIPATKSRAIKKPMSDADLCKGLREFVSSVGFPAGYVPSTKELVDHERKDLANIVRRRGHKFVKELLANSIGVDNRSDMECGSTQGQTVARKFEDDATGEKKVEDLTQETSKSIDDVSRFVNRSNLTFGSDVHLDDNFDMSSLEEKVQKFLKNGNLDLDIFEGSREHKKNSSGSNLTIHDQRDSSVMRDRKEPLMLNGTSVMSKPIANSAPRRNNMRDNDPSVESPADSAIGRDIVLETSKMESQDEVEHLKLILQQKELELSQLRELIEKEKQDLSTLQSKAEEEIKNAQKLITEMDAELLAAEDSLAGLKEVLVQYKGEAQVVEIAGSFNGWHQRLKMDPHPDTAEDPIKSRNPKLWCTSLWLYPGQHEIKFIVDGEWKVDPEREINTRTSGTQNNILRVDV